MQKLLIEKLFLFRIPDTEDKVCYLPLLMTSHLEEKWGARYKKIRELVPLFTEKGARLPENKELILEKTREHIRNLSENNKLYHSMLIPVEKVEKVIRKQPGRFDVYDVDALAEKLFRIAEAECEDLEEYIRRNLRMALVKRKGDKFAVVMESVTSDALCASYNQMESHGVSYFFTERMDYLGKHPHEEIFMRRGKSGTEKRVLVEKNSYYVLDVTPEETVSSRKKYLIGAHDLVTSIPQRALKFPDPDSAVEYALSHMINIKSEVFDVLEMEEKALLSMKKSSPDRPFWT